MSLNVIPTNIGGIQIPINPLEGPLASLFSTDKAQSLVFPQDLASNPAYCHAVQFSVYEYTTDASSVLSNVTNVLAGDTKAVDAAKNKIATGMKNLVNDPLGTIFGNSSTEKEGIIPSAAKTLEGASYIQKEGKFLSYISLFMPDTLYTDYDSTYTDISLTDEIGLKGIGAQTVTDVLGAIGPGKEDKWANLLRLPEVPYNVGQTVGKLGKTQDFKDFASQSLGVVTNPQVQLLYKGQQLRTFNLEFLLTPRDAKEAKEVKDIIDAFTYYSLPSIAGKQLNNSGQFLLPPQIFKIRFAFTSSNGIAGAVADVFKTAFNNIGLGFLNTTDQSGTIKNSPDAKIYTIPNPCVLDNFSVDYAPNGWAAYNDGNPVQTRLTLTFRETQITTKDSLKKSMSSNKIFAADPATTPKGTSSTDLLTKTNNMAGNFNTSNMG